MTKWTKKNSMQFSGGSRDFLLQNRIIFILIMVMLFNAVLVFRVFELHFAGTYINSNEGLNWDKSGNFIRHNIVDSKGRVLASNLNTASLYTNPQTVADPQKAAKAIAKIFPEIGYEKVLAKLQSNAKFVWIKRHLTPREQQKINSLGLHNFVMIDDQKRIYPNLNNLSHVIGYVDIDGKGIAGIERQYEQYLSLPSSGDLELTIDIDVQTVVADVLAQHIAKQDAIGGVAILLDPYSGEIKAMVSQPDFDPNNIDDLGENLFNRATSGLYEPGSTAKIFNVAAAIEEKLVNENDIYDVSQPFKYGKFSINDYRGKGGNLSLPELLMYSSNLGLVQIVANMGVETQRQYINKFGLANKIDLDLPETSRPLLPAGKWSELSSATISFGHGFAVSPLHVVMSYAALVNGGYLIKPKLVKGLNKNNPERILSKDTSEKMRKLMRLVVTQGSARKAEVEGYYVAGKTGTAEKIKNGKYQKNNTNIASFCGAFPIHDPQYVLYVMIDEARPNKHNHGFTTGGMVAAPLVHDIIKNIAPLLEVMPVNSDNKKAEIEKALRLEFTPQYRKVSNY